MKPREEAKLDLVRRWVVTAEEDWELVSRLATERDSFLSAKAFHSKQTAEKYL